MNTRSEVSAGLPVLTECESGLQIVLADDDEPDSDLEPMSEVFPVTIAGLRMLVAVADRMVLPPGFSLCVIDAR